MNLHHDKEAFEELIVGAANNINVRKVGNVLLLEGASYGTC